MTTKPTRRHRDDILTPLLARLWAQGWLIRSSIHRRRRHHSAPWTLRRNSPPELSAGTLRRNSPPELSAAWPVFLVFKKQLAHIYIYIYIYIYANDPSWEPFSPKILKQTSTDHVFVTIDAPSHNFCLVNESMPPTIKSFRPLPRYGICFTYTDESSSFTYTVNV